MDMKPGLYLVATPIGTADDITLRALEVLRRADVLAAEDTRNARRLMELHGLSVGGRPLVAYHDHNGQQVRPRLMAALAEGKTIAYVSDAGTPLVADPGYRLAEAAIAQGHLVSTTPGASALLAALAVAGLPTNRFLFAGFAPPKSAARKSFLAEFATVPATLVFYESPKRLAKALADMVAVLGDRPAAVCRELTKKFEEVRRGSLLELAAAYPTPPKGEIVVVVGPPEVSLADARDIDTALRSALDAGSVRDAAQQVADDLGIPRKQAYARALELARE